MKSFRQEWNWQRAKRGGVKNEQVGDMPEIVTDRGSGREIKVYHVARDPPIYHTVYASRRQGADTYKLFVRANGETLASSRLWPQSQ